jgi:hypothetical protein
MSAGQPQSTDNKRYSQITTLNAQEAQECPGGPAQARKCREKANDILNRVQNQWNPNKMTPQRHNLWHTPSRLKKNKDADPAKVPVLYNPDTRSKHSLLGGIRIFGTKPGHKVKNKDPFEGDRIPARIEEGIEPSGRTVTISTDGSAIKNGWENATAGVGVWYGDGDERNISLRLESNGTKTASNSRAELGAILEALRQNNEDDLVIESDSLTSLRAICNQSDKYEDMGGLAY